jgi:hypothetical protein
MNRRDLDSRGECDVSPEAPRELLSRLPLDSSEGL